MQPKEPMYYLWFIGVEPEKQGSGIGTKFFTEILDHSKNLNRPIYLETSTLRNIPWYKQFGFEIYSELDFGYKLFFLRRLIN
jgi:ribosomal protein S18 acetylase RimI-like enzyme